MRCPTCHKLDDRVIDSRSVDDGAGIRRRRRCDACGSRFTTFERIEEAPLVVVKSDGCRQPFDREKIVSGVLAAAKGRPIAEEHAQALAASVEAAVGESRSGGGEVTSADVGRLVLDGLRDADEVTYLRFASVYKAFQGLGDFEEELGRLSKVSDPPARLTAQPRPEQPEPTA